MGVAELAIDVPVGVALVAYLVVGLVIGVESMGVPLPGETTLIAAALLASQGELQLPIVIASAATGAIIGDSVGYAIGRRLRPAPAGPEDSRQGRADQDPTGRSLFERLGRRFRHFGPDRLERAERYFEKYGVWTVFFGRFVALLRIFAGPMAGMLRMPYPRFLVANATGGVAWATIIGLVAFHIGDNAERLFGQLSIWALVAVILAAVAGYVLYRVRRRRGAAGLSGADV